MRFHCRGRLSWRPNHRALRQAGSFVLTRVSSVGFDGKGATFGVRIDVRLDVLPIRRGIPVLCLLNAVKANDGDSLEWERRGSLTKYSDVIRRGKHVPAGFVHYPLRLVANVGLV